MRVGIDIDDTICNSRKVLIPFLSKTLGIKYKKVKKEEYEYFKEKYKNYFEVAKDNYDTLVMNIKLKPGTIKYLNKIKKRGHEIIFLTSRYYKEFKNPYETTYTYLKNNNIPFDKLILCADDKGKICKEEKIDIFFDDNFKNYISVKNTGIDVYLMDDIPNIKIKGVKRIFSVRDMYLKIKRKEKYYGGKNNN